MAPPLIITEPEISELGRRVRAALDRVLAGVPAASRTAADKVT
jgi:4-aminobutyrate--pyruvate transaminase